jgi:PD-(D/E)XK nuclease superfamily
MPLPPNFQFSQASLGDYVDCARRFQLRYLLEQDWPAVESEPLLERERLADLGRRFHKLIQQHVEGLPVDALTRSLGEAELIRWWQSYLTGLNTTLIDLPSDRRAEVAVSIPFGAYRLTAHFDLVAVDAQQAVIVDWKTERRKPTRDQLLNRMQTRVYRLVLTEAQQRAPGTVSMLYWFAEYPDQPEVLRYDAAQQAADHQFLTNLIADIENLATPDPPILQRRIGYGQDSTEDSDKFLNPSQGDEWPKTPNLRKCDFCAYRSLCNRGVSAGVIDPDAGDLDLELEVNLDEIDEIAY